MSNAVSSLYITNSLSKRSGASMESCTWAPPSPKNSKILLFEKKLTQIHTHIVDDNSRPCKLSQWHAAVSSRTT